MTYRGIHSTFPMNSTMNCKQGYLHIKRERSSSAVTTRVLFKPWQTAYFVLRKNPYLLEEYKDASLKTQKQIHFIGTVKHVGLVRTSKSKQYAFEVVMQENTPLLLACENGLLRDEWISAFEQVMRDVNKMKEKNLRKNLGNFNDVEEIHDVTIMPNTLSERNNLRGDYIMVLNPVRIILQNVDTKIEFLSWPLSHITYYKGTPMEKKIIFVMSKNCHFGPGKLLFHTKSVESVVDFLDKYFNNNSPVSLHKLESSHSFSDSSTSSNSESNYTISPKKLDQTRLYPNLDNFDDSRLSVSLYEKSSTAFVENEKISISIPNMSSPLSDDYDDVSEENTHEFIGNVDGISSVKSEGDLLFGPITNEESYIKPNEPDVNTEWNLQHTNFKRFSDRRTQLKGNSGQTFPPESEDNFQTSYLQLNDTDDSDGDKESDDVAFMLKSVESSLQNPMHQSTKLTNKFFGGSKSKSTSTPSPKLKKGKESRRQSEPAKNKNMKTTPSFDQDLAKFKSSVRNSPKFNKASASKQNSFPKKHSISSQLNANPFSIGEKHFITSPKGFHNKQNEMHQGMSSRYAHNKKNFVSTIRRNPTDPVLPSLPTPELDRRLKPKPKVPLMKQSSNKNDLFLPVKSNDCPPPLPERYSPNELSNHKPLERTSDSEFSKKDNRNSVVTDSLMPPPVPPKQNLLSSTKSAPLSNSFDLPTPEEELRRSSFSDVPTCRYESIDDIQSGTDATKVDSNPSPDKLSPNQNNVFSNSENNISCSKENKNVPIGQRHSNEPIKKDLNTEMPLSMRKSLPSNLNNTLGYSLDSSQFKLLAKYTQNENFKMQGFKENEFERSKKVSVPKKLFASNMGSDFPKSPKTFY